MSYEGILDDEALAPLKRNHACFQCKKRKVKCDAVSQRESPRASTSADKLLPPDPTNVLPLPAISRARPAVRRTQQDDPTSLGLLVGRK